MHKGCLLVSVVVAAVSGGFAEIHKPEWASSVSSSERPEAIYN